MYKILNTIGIALLFIMIVVAIITSQIEIALLGLILSMMMIDDFLKVKR